MRERERVHARACAAGPPQVTHGVRAQEMQLPQRTGPSAGIHASRTEGRATESVTHVDTKSDADVAAPMLQQPPEDRADARESTHETGPTAGAAPAAPPASAALLPKPYRVGSIDRTGVA